MMPSNTSIEKPRVGFSERLTHRANLKHTRYGWLRLTPAYSVHLVVELLRKHGPGVVLDPFCGTGTTALACAQQGHQADTIDINPFLVWLARTKCSAYGALDLEHFVQSSSRILASALDEQVQAWSPPIHEIEKWWDSETLRFLGRAMAQTQALAGDSPATDLLKLVFCRVMIESANVSFGHQSMSFKAPQGPWLFCDRKSDFAANWVRATKDILAAAQSPILAEARVMLVDARTLNEVLAHDHYDLVITSPPYPNRMSYIRELRPYMYWLGFLTTGREAGELDWESIGGTWGCATSNLQRWSPKGSPPVPFDDFEPIIAAIQPHSRLLSAYVDKYFRDMGMHIRAVYGVVKRGGKVNYIVGNSKFYDVILPVEQIFAAMFRDAGFENVSIEALRKRTSKKELYEFLVSGTKPS